MAHIHTEPGQHDLVVSMYIIRTDFARPKLMLHMHKKLNRWMQYGGHVELNENPWQAVEHEMLEETGYEFSQLKLLQPTSRIKGIRRVMQHPQPIYVNTHDIDETHNHIDLGYAFATEQEPKHKIGMGESDKVKLVSRAELLKLNDSEIFQGTKDVCQYVFDECLPNWEQVPATS